MLWQHKTFHQLNINQLYSILKLRVDVFVVEQACYYPEIDDLDRLESTVHVFAYQDFELVGYLRCLAPGTVYPHASAIGRVVIAPAARGLKLGHDLVAQGIMACQKRWPNHAIKISAQAHLQSYYQKHQFVVIGEEYLEDDIPHIAMIREP